MDKSSIIIIEYDFTEIKIECTALVSMGISNKRAAKILHVTVSYIKKILEELFLVLHGVDRTSMAEQAGENLLSSEGIKLRGQRCIEPENSFGQIKWNRKFKRFLLRGMKKVNIEWGLIALAHNFCKLAAVFGTV